MTRLLLLLLFLAASVTAGRAQFVVTPLRVDYVTNGAFISARCAYFLPPERTYIGEQVDASGRRIRTVGLAQLTTGGGTVTHSIQLQQSIVQPASALTLYRIVDVTGASSSRIAELRDIPLSIYPPSPTLGPAGLPAYKTTTKSGVLTLTAERRFGEWFLLEEFRSGAWLPARWVPLGGKSTFAIGQRFVGTNLPPTWRVSTWRPGVYTPPLPPGFSAVPVEQPASAEPQPPAFTPSASPIPPGETTITDWYHDRTNGLFFAWSWQQPNHHLVFEDSQDVTGPWTERAFWSCSAQSLLIIANFNGAMEHRFVRARNIPCAAAPSLSSTDAAFGVNVVIPTKSGPKAVIQLHSSRMRLQPGWTLYTAAHPTR